MENFGKKLKLARTQKGYARETFGEMLHLSASAIQHYEEGIRQPGLDLFFHIAEVLDQPLEYFLDDSYSIFKEEGLKTSQERMPQVDRERLLEFEFKFCNAESQRDRVVSILELLSVYCCEQAQLVDDAQKNR